VFDLEEERQAEYDKLTKAIARAVAQEGFDGEKAIALMLKRARVLNLSMNRVKIALKLVLTNRSRRSSSSMKTFRRATSFAAVLTKCRGFEHDLPLEDAREGQTGALHSYRTHRSQVLVTAGTLDEGFNVPETEIGIIAASTATRRQRIQRLGTGGPSGTE